MTICIITPCIICTEWSRQRRSVGNQHFICKRDGLRSRQRPLGTVHRHASPHASAGSATKVQFFRLRLRNRCDSVRWGLHRSSSAEACWSPWTFSWWCHFGQRRILQSHGFVGICSKFWPVLDAKSVLIIWSFLSWWFWISLDFIFRKNLSKTNPHIPDLHTANCASELRNSHKRAAIARAMSTSDFPWQSMCTTSGRKTMWMYPCGSQCFSRWPSPHGGCGGYVSSIFRGTTWIPWVYANCSS